MPKSTGDGQKIRRPAPGTTLEARENQIISLAYDLVEERILKKTATSQDLSLFLKIGTSKAQLEKAKLEQENKLLEAKTELIASQKRIEELYAQAIKSMAVYQGRDDHEDDFED